MKSTRDESSQRDCLLNAVALSMANCCFAKPHRMKHCYIPFLMLLISNALLILARHSLTNVANAVKLKPSALKSENVAIGNLVSISRVMILGKSTNGI
jgi:hypothetical protein